jgi:hypothetical protein
MASLAPGASPADQWNPYGITANADGQQGYYPAVSQIPSPSYPAYYNGVLGGTNMATGTSTAGTLGGVPGYVQMMDLATVNAQGLGAQILQPQQLASFQPAGGVNNPYAAYTQPSIAGIVNTPSVFSQQYPQQQYLIA